MNLRPLKRIRCRVKGHKFTVFGDGLKRLCDHCGREEWVFSKPYPLIGEPKYSWRDMSRD
jgi:hypothetical protein